MATTPNFPANMPLGVRRLTPESRPAATQGAYARPDDPVMCGRIVKDQNSVEIEPETEALEFVDA
jgi:hypothetical protein